MSQTLIFPPLMWGEAAPEDAFDHARQKAIMGCDAGLVSYHLGASEIQAALVFTPDISVAKSMSMLPLCAIGFQNALGALAPPEVAVHLEWNGAIRVNSARCGQFKVWSSSENLDDVPDWFIVGFTLPLVPPHDDMGHTPDQTALFAEGCADVSPPTLVEAWARHTLHWIHHWESSGSRVLHEEWRGLAHGVGEEITQNGITGHFLGIDEDFGMLLRDEAGKTHLIALTDILET